MKKNFIAKGVGTGERADARIALTTEKFIKI